MRILTKDNLFMLVPPANIVLIATGTILAMYLYASVASTYDASNLKMAATLPQSVELMQKSAQEASGKLPVFMIDIFKKKQLFNQALTKKPDEEYRAYVLVGVSMGQKNSAVIKDTKDNKSYYCHIGDPVGDFRVREIMKDKVILESENGSLEISR